jgi:hypothetical protein
MFCNENEFSFALFRINATRMGCAEGLILRRNKLVYEVTRNTAAVGKIVR